jgi:hypothetical protein
LRSHDWCPRYLGDDDDDLDLPDCDFGVESTAPNLPGPNAAVAHDVEEQGIDVSKKKRAPKRKIDDERLLGPNGFPALLAQAKKFKFGPKGKEVRSCMTLRVC